MGLDAAVVAGDWENAEARRRQWAIGLLLALAVVIALMVRSGPPYRLFALVLGMFGAGALLWWHKLRQESTPFADGIVTHAVVVGYERHLSPPSTDSQQLSPSVKWASVLERRLLDGGTASASDAPATRRRPLGASVQVSYRADKPAQMRNLDSRDLEPMWAYLGGGIALIAAAVGLLVADLVALA